MKRYYRHKGFALAGAIMFLLLVMIMWLSVTRQIGTNLNVEEHLQTQKAYYNGCIRALAWGLTLCETGCPQGDTYSCKMQVSSQAYVVTFSKITGHTYDVTARPAETGDESLPDAPKTFASSDPPGHG